MFEKATKSKSKLRCAIYGPSGAGKTYSALSIAKGMGGKVALIDSERGSANKYADRFDFDIAELESKSIDEYTKFIVQASSYDILIIDSLSHAWRELVAENDKLANGKYKNNSYQAWSVSTPRQKQFIDSIISFKGHVIATMRSKTEWAMNKSESGSISPTRIGLSPEQGKSIEYEFDVLMEINPDHLGHIIKDRTGKYQDTIIDKPGEKFGQELIEWLNTGAEPIKKKPQGNAKQAIQHLIDKVKTEDSIQKFITWRESFAWTPEEINLQDQIIANIRKSIVEASNGHN